MRKHPIGIFDSGVGGLCVFKEIRKQLPDESIHYFADTSNCPYGSKEKYETLFLTRKNIDFLLEQGCKLIVIACNTATAVAIEDLRSEYKIPFVGMEPAIKPAAMQTKTRKIGVLATENTFKGDHFKQTYAKYASDVEVIAQAGNGLVELVEKGDLAGDEAKALLKKYLEPMIEQGADTLVLGCTHYPFLKDTINEVTDNGLNIIDPANAVAAQAKRILTESDLISDEKAPPKFSFYTTGETFFTEKFLIRTMEDNPYDLARIEI